MNTLWLDIKYAGIVGTRLERFQVKKTKPYLANCRCPFCGDSQTNKFKARGYIFENSGHLAFKCHNCGVSTNVRKVVQLVDPTLYDQYRLEILKEAEQLDIEPPKKFTSDITKFAKRRIDKFEPFADLKRISQLKHDHPAKKYVTERNIPSHNHFRIYYSPIYCSWVNSFIPDKFSEKACKHDEPRIIFPFIDKNGYLFGFTGRSISKQTTLRYSTIILDETKDKIFGLDSIDPNKTVYVVEGPIDSLFLDNCVAMAGADVRLTNITSQDKLVVIYDNEPRNAEIVKKIERMIDNGYKVCIWPDHVEEKDINDMVNSGLSSAAVQATIDQNTYSGLAAKLRLQTWRKI